MTGKITIGFCGLAGAGKDSLASAVERYATACGGKVARVALADPMRDMLLALGVPRIYMTNRDLKETPVPGFGRSYRQLAQTLGTEWGRNCHGEDFWVNAAAARVAAADADTVLITDVRFRNEADWLRHAGGYLVRVTRPDIKAVNAHASEAYAAQLPAMANILNEGSLEDLDAAAVALFTRVVFSRVRARNSVPESATL
jgi:hypothetical protein